MNNIQEKDWAEESWHGHTGMDSASDYCLAPSETGQESDDAPGQEPGDHSDK
ncbi:MAG: hypothetical protein FWG62_08300 [Proteobacteria bacterium]|nr:hypothetical protein [Pseudomonadota bacterium]